MDTNGKAVGNNEMRDQFYTVLKARYLKDPESLTTIQKAMLALFSSTRLLDAEDRRQAMAADLDRRCTQAEILLNHYEHRPDSFEGDIYDRYSEQLSWDAADAAMVLHKPNLAARIYALDWRLVRMTATELPPVSDPDWLAWKENEMEFMKSEDKAGWLYEDPEHEADHRMRFAKGFGEELLRKIMASKGYEQNVGSDART